MTIEFAEVNGIKMRYKEIANKEREVMVLLHFGGASLASWNGVVPYFEKHYHLLIPDLRGHGLTEQPEKDYHVDTMAKDIAELMEQKGLKKAHIIGSSLGADVALALGANHQERVSSLSLDGGFYDMVGENSKDQIKTEEEIKKAKQKLKKNILSREKKYYKSKEELVEAQKTNWEKHFPWNEHIREAIVDDLVKTDKGYTNAQTQETVWKYCEPLYDFFVMDYYKRIEVPVLIMPDEKEMESEIVKKNIETIKKILQYSKVVLIPGSVHAYTSMIKSKEFAETVLTFLKEIRK
jgi:2-succinyl-6-hydroxy-2,4-cyclohexadiene-1-carboxylate synthase